MRAPCGRIVASLVGCVLAGAIPSVALAADADLATAKLQKAAVACQKVIAQVDAKVVAGKLKALDACANAALTCVQTKHDATDCLAKAGGACAKKLAAAAGALTKAQAKIVSAKSCASDLRLPDLLSADGLGLGDLAGTCQTDFALDVCGGLDALAACLVRTHDRGAGARYGDLRPRTAELLTLVPNALPAVDGLASSPGCGTCGATPAARKAVEQCGKALSTATQTLVASLEKQLGTCAQKVLACIQTKAAAPECLAKATAGCDKGTDALATAFAKFAATVAKKCDASVVDFAELAAPAGLNLTALTPSCTVAPTDAASFAACLQERTRCATATLVRQSVPRTGEFGESGHLGTLASELTSTCPAIASTLKIAPPFAPRPFVFGSIIKFLKSVRRPTKTGTLVNGGAPPPSLNAGRGVIRTNGPTRVSLGGISKIPFRYRVGGALSRTAHATTAVTPPSLIVSVQRADVALDDHFEVELEPPVGATEVDDELEVTYQDIVPGCAFNLALATRIDGVVSEYTPILQVVDVPQPTPTPTATPPPTITQVIDTSGDGAGNTLADAFALAVDLTNGNLFVTGGTSNNAFKVTPGGTITEIIDATGDGSGHTLTFPTGIVVDGSGTAYVSGGGDNGFKISAGGAITQIIDATGDGTFPLTVGYGVAVDDTTGNVFVAGVNSDTVFKITSGGVITKIMDINGDGVNFANAPGGIAVNGTTGDVFVACSASHNVFKIATGGTITQILDASGDGAGHTLSQAVDVAVDGSSGNVFVTGGLSDNVFKVTPGGTITQIMDATGDGAGNTLDNPLHITTDATGNVYLAANLSRNAFKITPGGTITELIDLFGDHNGHSLQSPQGIAVDGSGNVFVGDRAGSVFKIAP